MPKSVPYRGAPVAWTAVACVVLCSGAALGQRAGDDRGTWPQVAPSVTVQDGWVVLVGRVEGFPDRVAWRVWLAPDNGGVRMEEGSATTLVVIGDREFVVENATGDTHELREGRLWRRIAPGEPARAPQPNTTPPAQMPSPPEYRTGGATGASGEAAGGYLLLPPPPAPVRPGAAVDDPRTQEIRRHTRLLEDQLGAYEDVIAASGRLNQLRQSPDTPRSRLEIAQQELDHAIARLQTIQNQLAQRQPDLAALGRQPPAMPTEQDLMPFATPDLRQRIGQLRDETLTLNTRLRRQRDMIDQMRRNSVPRFEIIEASETLAMLERRLDQSQASLEFAQLQAMSPPPQYIDPGLRRQIGHSERDVLALMEQRQQAQRWLRWGHDAYEQGRISWQQRQDLVDHAQSIDTRLLSARNELQDLQQVAIAQYNQRGGATAGAPATAPAPQGGD